MMKIVFVILALLSGLSCFAERIAVYSGTFDPPHIAHQKIVEEILAKGIADKVYVIPDDKTDFKPDKLPFHHRLNMVKLMFEGNSRVTFFTNSMQNQLTPSGEISNVMNVVQKTHPQDEIMWVMGRDTFDKYPTKIAPTFKNKNFSLVVMERGNGKKLPDSINGQKILNLDFDMSEVSSTEVRRALDEGERSRHLPERVFRYISRHGLYQNRIYVPNTSCVSRGLDRLLANP